jgi:hypothetical protein
MMSKKLPRKIQHKSSGGEPSREYISRPLDELDYMIFKVQYEHPAIGDVKTAKFLNINRSTVAERKKNPMYQLYVEEKTRPIARRVEEGQKIGLDTLMAECNAKDKEGKPDHQARVAAARELAKPALAQKFIVQPAPADPLASIAFKSARDMTETEIQRAIDLDAGENQGDKSGKDGKGSRKK